MGQGEASRGTKMESYNREKSFSASYLPHVVGNVKVHVYTNDQSDEVLRQCKVLVNDGKV